MTTLEQRKQLSILGYINPESRVRVRCFAPKGMPLDEQLERGMAWQKDEKTIISTPIEGWLYLNKGQGVFVRLKKKRSNNEVELDANGNPIWIEAKTYQDGLAYLHSLNAKGYGMYLVVNEGGGTDADITRFPALFYECDGVAKEKQWQRLRSLEAKLGRPASKVVETRNSLHCYFALVYDNLMPSTWTEYQQRLIQEQDSDKAIWNAARLMRLAGFDHQKWNPETGSLEQFPVRLVQENDNKFTLDEFDQILPKWDSERWQQRHQAPERVATTPDDNPWDIRNFVHYLDGFKSDGRRGWDTCRCPAHNGQSDNSLHIEQSTGAYKCHGGCDPKDVYNAALDLAKSRGYQVPEQRTGHRFSDFLSSGLFKLKQRLAKAVERRNFWGFGKKGEVEVEPTLTNSAPAIEYQIGERLDVWAEASKQGYKYIIDVGATGTGKSFDAGMATSKLFDVRQLIYASAEHRNPSTPTLTSWSDLEARHKGLYKDQFGKLRRVKSGEPYLISPNCGRVDTISALRNKNIPGADTSEQICATCKFLEFCKAGIDNYNYLNKRAETLSQERFRTHPTSLPESDDFDYSETVVIWDEAGEILKNHRSIEVMEKDLSATVAQLALKSAETFDALRPLLIALNEYLTQHKQPNKFGWGDTQVRELLQKPDNVDIDAIALALKPDLDSLLNTTSEYGVDLADLPRQVRKDFSESDEVTADRVQREVTLNWLPDFLNVLLNNIVGSLRIQNGTLTITAPDQRLTTIAQAAKVNIFLDATASSEDLARVLGCNPEEILTVRQTMPDTSNLEVVQIATMGRLGLGSRRKDKDGNDSFLQKRIDALITQIKQDTPGNVGVIDFKRNTKQGDDKRHWWTSSRGINDLEDCDALALVGVPCRNLAALEAEFTILYGRTPKEGTERIKYPIQIKDTPSSDLQPWFEMEVSSDPEFRAFVRRKILADIHQAIGRLRAHRRRGKRLKVYIIADCPLDIPVTLKRALDITPEAATKVERVEMAIKAAVQQLRDAGRKITQDAIASITGYSQQYISRFRVLLQMLLSDSNSICSKTGSPPPDPPPDPEDTQWMSSQYLPLLADAPINELLEGILTTFEAYGYRVFQEIWDATPAPTQVKILTALMFTLNASELRILGIAVGVKT